MHQSIPKPAPKRAFLARTFGFDLAASNLELRAARYYAANGVWDAAKEHFESWRDLRLRSRKEIPFAGLGRDFAVEFHFSQQACELVDLLLKSGATEAARQDGFNLIIQNTRGVQERRLGIKDPANPPANSMIFTNAFQLVDLFSGMNNVLEHRAQALESVPYSVAQAVFIGKGSAAYAGDLETSRAEATRYWELTAEYFPHVEPTILVIKALIKTVEDKSLSPNKMELAPFTAFFLGMRIYARFGKWAETRQAAALLPSYFADALPGEHGNVIRYGQVARLFQEHGAPEEETRRACLETVQATKKLLRLLETKFDNGGWYDLEDRFSDYNHDWLALIIAKQIVLRIFGTKHALELSHRAHSWLLEHGTGSDSDINQAVLPIKRAEIERWQAKIAQRLELMPIAEQLGIGQPDHFERWLNEPVEHFPHMATPNGLPATPMVSQPA